MYRLTDSYLSLNSRILSSQSRDIFFFDLMVHIEAARLNAELNEADTATLMESF
jgi:hypothetical protein